MIYTGRERILWTLRRIVKEESATGPRKTKGDCSFRNLTGQRLCDHDHAQGLERSLASSITWSRTTPSSGELAVA